MFVEPSRPARRSRFTLRRSSQADYPLALIDHGLELLQAIDEMGFATHAQLSRLLFDGKPGSCGVPRSDAAAKRAAARSLQRMWRSGFTERRSIFLTSKRTGFGYQHFVNVLTKKGARALQEQIARTGQGQLRWTPAGHKLSLQTIEHSLAINDFYVTVRRAAEEAGIGFHEWRDDRQLTAMNNRGLLKLVSIPDAFFVLERDGQFYGHFLEIDTGTETSMGRFSERSWVNKIRAYGEYFRELYPQDGYFRGFTAPIVLTVTNSERRMDGLLQATRTARGRGVYWYTTRSELDERLDATTSPLWQPIWRVVNEPTPRSLLNRMSSMGM